MTRSEIIQTPVRRTWFITGASSGIGHAFAVAALEAGDNVAGLARDSKPVAELADRYPARVLAIDTDITDESAVNSATDQTVERFGRIDVVVSNAAFGIFGGVEEHTDAQWRAIFDTNVFGALNVLRATLPVLRAQNSGWILQGSAHYGQHAHAGVSAVAATKHAMEGWTDSLAEELAPLGIKVLNYEPGMTTTPFLSKLTMGENASTDYDQTVRANLQKLGQMTPDMFNTAKGVVAAVSQAMRADTPPRRLATGNLCYQMIKTTLTERLNDLETWAPVTTAVPAAG